jgi:hypothetical protein
MEEEDGSSEIVCARCETHAGGAWPTRDCSIEKGERRYLCGSCSREIIHAIESPPDSASWYASQRRPLAQADLSVTAPGSSPRGTSRLSPSPSRLSSCP